jgi:ABC-2 type transport system ATP-binding protein
VLAAHKASGKTLLFSTHVMEQAEKLCDHIALIAGGRVVLSGELAAIKRQRGADRYRVQAEGDLDKVRSLPGVAAVAAKNGGFELTASPGVDGGALLRELVSFLSVREFRSAEPTLEEIFVEAVGDAQL